MYELLDPIDYHQLPNYRSVIDSLSYYQFVILRLVVGDERINQVLISEKSYIKSFKSLESLTNRYNEFEGFLFGLIYEILFKASLNLYDFNHIIKTTLSIF